MEFPIVAVLIAVTFGAVLVFAIISKKKTEERLEDDDAPKSTLASDKSSTGNPADV